MEELVLNGESYKTLSTDFPLVPHQEYNNLRIHPQVGNLERLIGLICDLAESLTPVQPTFLNIGWAYGGFVPINCSKKIPSSYILAPSHHNSDILCKHNLQFISQENLHTLSPNIIFVEELAAKDLISTKTSILDLFSTTSANTSANKSPYNQFILTPVPSTFPPSTFHLPPALR